MTRLRPLHLCLPRLSRTKGRVPRKRAHTRTRPGHVHGHVYVYLCVYVEGSWRTGLDLVRKETLATTPVTIAARFRCLTRR